VGCEVDDKGIGNPAKVGFGGNEESEPKYNQFCIWWASLFGLGPEVCK
jgi:hypothetical protein